MFAEDVADMGCIAARDFEDILQCCMPVFKGLLPEECDEPVQTLLFLFAEWHGLAKLRLHTTATLKIFKSITSRLGTALRNFAKLTKDMEVCETPKEYTRQKKQAEASKVFSMTQHARTTANTACMIKGQSQQNPGGDGRRICTLNLVFKYVHIDLLFQGELQNHKFKGQYMRTNKCNAVKQMTEIDDIMAALLDIDKELQESFKALPAIDSGAIDSLVGGQPYFIGQKERSEDMIPNIPTWIAGKSDDNAVKQDILNNGTSHCFVMLPTESEQEPNTHLFIYAKVLGVYHTNIVYHNRPPKRMDFVHVRWLYYDYERPGRWDNKRLDRVTYLACDTNDDILDSFDFIDPSNILQATHMIPDFCSDTTRDLLGHGASIAYDNPEFGDWKGYYVNRFVDRDMLMRYVGGDEIQDVLAQDPGMGETIEVHEDNDDQDSDTDEDGDGVEEGGLDAGLVGDGDGEDDEEEEIIDEDEDMEDNDGDSTDIDEGDNVEDDDLYGF
ncbi:hypothetical protein FRC06_003664 [Ceratobasidium sp. 370]|nr:hypothetical protein FRC06_003664 [Ceratobasidium sp. 370]